MELVTGDAPQPGETPRTEGNPWSFDPDAAWWRGDGDRENAEELAEAATRPSPPGRRTSPATPGSPTSAQPPGSGDAATYVEEAIDAHAAGVHDTANELTTETQPPPAVQVEAEQAGTIEKAEAAATAETTAQIKTAENTAQIKTDTITVESDPPDLADARHASRDRQPPDLEHDRDDDPRINDVPEIDLPDFIARPQGDWNRPTVTLNRGPVPDQPSEPAPRTKRLGQARISAAELNLKRSRVENSPFWLNDDGLAAVGNAWPAPELRGTVTDTPADERRGLPPRHRARTPRAAAPGLFGLIALALIAAFFSWVSAEPFWLAVGHGDRGIATVTRCTGSGITKRCAGSFAAADGSFSSGRIGLLGVPDRGSHPGAVTPARMVNPSSKQAYAGSTSTLLQVRWVLGFLLVLLCGLGIAGLTGTRQLETIRARRAALVMSMVGPLMLLAGFLLASF